MTEIHRDLGNGAALGGHRFAGFDLPACQPDGPDAHHGEKGSRALGEARRKRRRGGDLSEEGHPDACPAGMLVGEDTHDAPFLEKVARPLHPLLLVEREDAATAAVTIDQIVHEWVADRLVDTAGLARLHEFRDLGVDLPVAVMTERGDGASFPGLFSDDPILPGLLVVKAETGAELLLTECRDLDGTEEIRSEAGKVLSDQGCGLPVVQSLTPAPKGNAEIPFGETAVAGQNHPDHESDELSQHEADGDGQQSDERDHPESQQVNQTIHEQKRRKAR